MTYCTVVSFVQYFGGEKNEIPKMSMECFVLGKDILVRLTTSEIKKKKIKEETKLSEDCRNRVWFGHGKINYQNIDPLSVLI